MRPAASPSRWDSSGVHPTRFLKWSPEDGVPGAVAGNHPLSHHHLPLPVSSLVPPCALPAPGLEQGLLWCRTSFQTSVSPPAYFTRDKLLSRVCWHQAVVTG